ncbi:MAG: hypothetical protein KM310_01815 [Clostridiales bacterium]|nr:hypothetical protein [Clostridiales bacterium]
MDVTAVGGGGGVKPGDVGDRLAKMGSDTFMQLLVAQLKYQNPLQPQNQMDFVNQLALFSMIEQLQAIREELRALPEALQKGGAGDGGGTPQGD